MDRIWLRYPKFLAKALTLSYDDGVVSDKKLLKLMQKYGLKGTFNLNSGLFSDHTVRRMSREEALELYADSKNEIAVHGLKHLSLTELDPAAATYEIIADKHNLERMFSRRILGMAYAYGTYNDGIVEILKHCNIRYARTVISTARFDLPEDFLRLPATCHHDDPRLMELAERFLREGSRGQDEIGAPKLFYLWGHSYEFDDKGNWDVFEKFGALIGGRPDVWYATNGEIYEYVRAYRRLEFSADGRYAYNPSAIDVYLYSYGKNVVIPAGKYCSLD